MEKKTVYIPVSVQDELPQVNSSVYCVYKGVKDVAYNDEETGFPSAITSWLKEQNLYCFTEEELISLLRDAFYNGEEFGRDKITSDCYNENEYINSLNIK